MKSLVGLRRVRSDRDGVSLLHKRIPLFNIWKALNQIDFLTIGSEKKSQTGSLFYSFFGRWYSSLEVWRRMLMVYKVSCFLFHDNSSASVLCIYISSMWIQRGDVKMKMNLLQSLSKFLFFKRYFLSFPSPKILEF